MVLGWAGCDGLQGKAREGLLPRSQALPCPVLPA